MIVKNWRNSKPVMEPTIHGAGIDWRVFSRCELNSLDSSACLKKLGFFAFAMLQPSGSYQPHGHDHEEIYYIIKGKGIIKGIKENNITEDFNIRSGDVVITPVGEKHQIINNGCETIEFIAWCADERY